MKKVATHYVYDKWQRKIKKVKVLSTGGHTQIVVYLLKNDKEYEIISEDAFFEMSKDFKDFSNNELKF